MDEMKTHKNQDVWKKNMDLVIAFIKLSYIQNNRVGGERET